MYIPMAGAIIVGIGVAFVCYVFIDGLLKMRGE
jgi:hypothetical protein